MLSRFERNELLDFDFQLKLAIPSMVDDGFSAIRTAPHAVPSILLVVALSSQFQQTFSFFNIPNATDELSDYSNDKIMRN